MALIPTSPHEAAAMQIKREILDEFQRLRALFQRAATFVWANNALTPQQAVDAFGKDAAELGKISALTASYLAAATNTEPTSPVPAGFTWNANVDGTVTIGGPDDN